MFNLRPRNHEKRQTVYGPSPGRFALQLTILTLSATTACPPFSILNWTFLIKKVHTSSQNRYVSREPCTCAGTSRSASLLLQLLRMCRRPSSTRGRQVVLP